MRVLHITDRLSQRGGADWHLLGVVRNLARQCEVALAVGRDDATVEAPCPVQSVRGLDAQTPEEVTDELTAVATRFAPDVVHVHNAMNPVALAWAADRDAIMTVQDHRSFCPGRGKLTLAGDACRESLATAACDTCFTDAAYFRRIDARTRDRLASVRRMRAIIVLSEYMKAELVAAGVEAERVHVIPPFVHGLDPAAAPDGPPCVLFAGRLVTAKGVDDAVTAWRRSGVTLPLVAAGTGPERQRLEAAGVDVLGWVPHDRVSSVYARARAVIVPSVWQEPFGIVGLEALTMGVPVVAYDSGGVRDWHPGDATLVPWRDVDALAAALSTAVHGRAAPPVGFDRAALMARLDKLYRSGTHTARAGDRPTIA